MSNNYLEFIKKYIDYFHKNIIQKINKSNILFYFLYFLIFFILYFLNTASSTSNLFEPLINKLEKNKNYLIIFYSFIFIFIFYILGLGYYYSFKKNVNDAKSRVYIITGSIFCLFLALYLTIGLLKKYILKFSDLFFKIIKYLFHFINLLFLVIFFTLFYENLNDKYILEVFISFELIIIFIFLNITNIDYKFRKYNNLLNENDFALLTTNCKILTSENDTYNQSLKDLLNKKGNSYLRFSGNIPISFLNSNTNNYQNLKINDFYYPGSAYSYLADNPLNGTPSLKALEYSINKYKSRIIELDIYTDIEDSDPKSKLVVRSNKLKTGKSSLSLEDCFEVINKYAWMPNNSNKFPYPFFLILNCNFEEYESLYIKLYNSLLKYFAKYLLQKKYSFAGRNGLSPISKANMEECIGRIILISNKFPTHTILDEVINATTSHITPDFEMIKYSTDYADYEKIGISQDFDKTNLVIDSKNYFRLFKSYPVEEYFNINQPKSGLFNPNFQDVAQYGIQSTLMYLFLPDNNFDLWFEYFKNNSNFDPILKNESLRFIENKTETKEEVNPVAGLQSTQKYCVIPGGFLDTDLGNLSSGNNNTSCNEQENDNTIDINTGVSVT